MLNPNPELPDNIQIDQIQFSTRIRNALTAAGFRTVGDIREASDEVLLSLQNLGARSVTYLRDTLGLPSCDGVRPASSQNARPGLP
jgi:DNA-directed RNA polymerase alpha subunit